MNEKEAKLKKSLEKHQRDPPICQPCIDQSLDTLARDHSNLTHPSRPPHIRPATRTQLSANRPVQITPHTTRIDEVLDHNQWVGAQVVSRQLEEAPKSFAPLASIQELEPDGKIHIQEGEPMGALEHKIWALGFAGEMVADHLNNKIRFPLML